MTALILAVVLAGCLERNNPFDPANQVSPLIPKIRQANKPRVDSLSLAGQGDSAELQMFLQAYRIDSSANAKLADTNTARAALNVARTASNERIQEENDRAVAQDALKLLSEFLSLVPLSPYGPYDRLNGALIRLGDAQGQISKLMIAENVKYYPVQVYPQPFIDSTLKPITAKVSVLKSLSDRVLAANLEVGATNQSIGHYNDSIDGLNKQVRKYNAELDFKRETLKHGVITRADSLDAALDTAGAGDTLLLGPVVLSGDLRFRSGAKDNELVIRGYPGWKTVLRPLKRADSTVQNQAAIVDSSYIIFEDLVFRGGAFSGIKVQGGAKGITFKRCLFDSNGVRGIDATTSDLFLIDCEIRDNGSGLRVEASLGSGYELRLDNVLIAHNRGNGIEAVTPEGWIRNVTISDNAKDGLMITSHQRSLGVFNSVFSFNGGYGINLGGALPNNADGLKVEQTVFWNNVVDNWRLENMDSTEAMALRGMNMYFDPEFSDPATGDYSLRPTSPLVQLENLPVIIGYRRKP